MFNNFVRLPCVHKLLNALARAIGKVNVDDICGWFAHCGYTFSFISHLFARIPGAGVTRLDDAASLLEQCLADPLFFLALLNRIKQGFENVTWLANVFAAICVRNFPIGSETLTGPLLLARGLLAGTTPLCRPQYEAPVVSYLGTSKFAP